MLGLLGTTLFRAYLCLFLSKVLIECKCVWFSDVENCSLWTVLSFLIVLLVLASCGLEWWNTLKYELCFLQSMYFAFNMVKQSNSYTQLTGREQLCYNKYWGGLSSRKERMLRNVKSRHCYHSLWVLTLPSPIVASALPPLTLKKAFHKYSDIIYGRCSIGKIQKREYLHLHSIFTENVQATLWIPCRF